MKRNPFKIIPILLCLLWQVGLTAIHAQEVRFDMNQIEMKGEISSEGHMTFREIYTYDVEFMNGMYITIDHDQHNLTNYRVGIVDEQGDVTYLSEGLNGREGTYKTSDDGKLLKFQIFYPAKNEQVRVLMEYTLENLVTNYSDTAELYWALTGDQFDSTYDYHAIIELPGKVNQVEDFRTWAYGHYEGEVYPRTEDRSYIEVTVPNNPPNQLIGLRAIFPTSLTPNNPNKVDAAMKEQIIEKENQQVEADLQRREAKQRSLMRRLLALSLAPLFTIYVGYYYFSRKRRLNPNPVHIPDHVYSLPADLTPAIMATTVLRNEPNSDDFSATIIDMARKGYIMIEEVDREEGKIFRRRSQTVRISPSSHLTQERYNQLERHEKYVYDYLLPDDEPVILRDIEDRIRKESHFARTKNRLWNQFSNYVSAVGEKQRQAPAERQVAISLAMFNVFVSIGLCVLMLVWVIDSPLANWLQYIGFYFAINAIAAIILMILTAAKPIRSYEEDKQIKEWQGFANMLDDIGNMRMREIASLPLWEEYLAYAVSLNVADKVIEAMNQQYHIEELQTEMHMPLVFYRNPYWINQVIRPTINQSIADAAPKPVSSKYTGSNTGGFGGGFSGGSFGGGGGGGGASGF